MQRKGDLMIKCTCCGTTSDNLEDNVAMIALSPPGSENRKWACTKCLSTYPDLAHKVNKSRLTVINCRGNNKNIYTNCKYYRTHERCGADNKKPTCNSKCYLRR